jgi:hypothetical protein
MSLTPRLDRLEKNHIINGNFDFWQRGTSFPAAGSGTYTADRWLKGYAGTPVLNVNRVTDTPTISESGFQSDFSIEASISVAQPTPVSGDRAFFQYRMEGYDWATLQGKKCTLSFWVKASKTGINSISFRNTDTTQSYIVEYTIDSPDTWEKKEISLDFTTIIGTQEYTNGAGAYITFPFMPDLDLQTGTLNQWTSGNFIASTNQVNNLDNVLNTFKLSQVMLNVGEQAGSFSRAGRTIAEELQLCQRYYEAQSYAQTIQTSTVSGANDLVRINFAIPKVKIPAVSGLTPSGTLNTLSFVNISNRGFNVRVNVSGSGVGSVSGTYAAEAEL